MLDSKNSIIFGSAFMNIGGSGFSATLTPEDKEKSAQFLNNMQLGSGWIVIPDTLIKHELLVSSIIQGVDLCNLYFYIPLSSASPTRGKKARRLRIFVEKLLPLFLCKVICQI